MQPITTPTPVQSSGSLGAAQKFFSSPQSTTEQIKQNNKKVVQPGELLESKLGKKSRPYVYENLIAGQNKQTGAKYSVDKEMAAKNLQAIASTIEATIGTQIDIIA